MKKLILSIFVLGCFCTFSDTIQAQDNHFSQFRNLPALHNPAQSGLIENAFRFSLFHKNQFPTLNAFKTYGASLDMRVGEVSISDNNGVAFGVGASLLTDAAGDGALKTNKFSIQAATHLNIGRNHILSIGFQFASTRRSVDYNALTFDSQWAGNMFDPTLVSFEPPQGHTSLNFLEFSSGLNWRTDVFDDNKFILMGGVAVHRFNQPIESFYEEFDYPNPLRRKMRIYAHGGLSFKPNKNFKISPTIAFMHQNASIELAALVTAEWKIDKFGFGIGAGYRMNDALFPYVSVSYDFIEIAFSYDVNVGGEKTGALANAGPEIVISILETWDRLGLRKRTGTKVSCPKW